jgi:putative DNA primase/helicase
MDGNADLIAYLQRVAGYVLTGDVSEQCLWFLHGGGQNGKSVFLLTLLEVMGDYAMQGVSELLMAKHNESHPTERADLFGKRMVAVIETEHGRRMAEALVKQLTGGDRIKARYLYKDFFEFNPTHKIFLAANHKPTIVGTDLAIWRRIKLVPFTVTIPEKEKDKNLAAKLAEERSGILAWKVRGCLDWQKHGMEEPDKVRKATAAYQAEQNTLAQFIAECCFVHREVRCKATDLFDAYQRWSGNKFTTAHQFRNEIANEGFEMKAGHGNVRYWHGIGLIKDGENE